MRSMRMLSVGALFVATVSIAGPAVVQAQQQLQSQPQSCTFCTVNPWTYEITCFRGATQGDSDCWCWQGGCALV